MKKNVGSLDAKIRYGVGIIFIILSFFFQPFWLFLVLGVISFATAYFHTCGLYKLFGVNTCQVDTEEE
ncbi:MAG: DUF2892 domain-containing protein [Candidatus Izemoplasma sp.]|nr:DUF2892 domain-containing protein [Candidatus Izemoplasma sp.]